MKRIAHGAGHHGESLLAGAIAELGRLDGSAEQLGRLRSRLEEPLASPTVLKATGGASLGLLGTASIVALALGALWWFDARQSEPRPAALRAATPAAPLEAPAPAMAPVAPQPPPAEPHVMPPARAALQRPARAVEPSRPQAAPPADPQELPPRALDPEAELALIDRALAQLDHSPAGALALVQQHERDFAAGVFAQERELLAIEALLKLRQRSAAEARAARFAVDFPRSPHMHRVRVLLGTGTQSETRTKTADHP